MTISITFEGMTQESASAVIGALSACEAALPTALQTPTQPPFAAAVAAPQAMPAAVPVQPPVQQAQVMPAPVTVPTQAPAYTLEQLERAGVSLAQSGKGQQAMELLKSFGIASLKDLPAVRYGEFATAIRQIGGQI